MICSQHFHVPCVDARPGTATMLGRSRVRLAVLHRVVLRSLAGVILPDVKRVKVVTEPFNLGSDLITVPRMKCARGKLQLSVRD